MRSQYIKITNDRQTDRQPDDVNNTASKNLTFSSVW